MHFPFWGVFASVLCITPYNIGQIRKCSGFSFPSFLNMFGIKNNTSLLQQLNELSRTDCKFCSQFQVETVYKKLQEIVKPMIVINKL